MKFPTKVNRSQLGSMAGGDPVMSEGEGERGRTEADVSRPGPVDETAGTKTRRGTGPEAFCSVKWQRLENAV